MPTFQISYIGNLKQNVFKVGAPTLGFYPIPWGLGNFALTAWTFWSQYTTQYIKMLLYWYVSISKFRLNEYYVFDCSE